MRPLACGALFVYSIIAFAGIPAGRFGAAYMLILSIGLLWEMWKEKERT